MGTIGNAKRFTDKTSVVETPGVGSYNIAPFKSLGKVAESTFDLGNFKKTIVS